MAGAEAALLIGVLYLCYRSIDIAGGKGIAYRNLNCFDWWWWQLLRCLFG